MKPEHQIPGGERRGMGVAQLHLHSCSLFTPEETTSTEHAAMGGAVGILQGPNYQNQTTTWTWANSVLFKEKLFPITPLIPGKAEKDEEDADLDYLIHPKIPDTRHSSQLNTGAGYILFDGWRDGWIDE